jgi:methionyl-tRNA formyltransferase
MRLSIIGQAAFGEAVLRALQEDGNEVVAVSAVPGTPERPDPLWQAAQDAGIPLFPTGGLKRGGVLQAYEATRPDLCVMAFVTHILPERVLTAPRLGSIQYHPSLLPRHRGRSAMHWAIRMGETKTGVTIFWVDEGIDTGPVLLQRECEITPDDTVGSLYFDKAFPLGVEALVESVRLVRDGAAPRRPQDETQATYEPPAEDANSGIAWTRPARDIYNLVRGSNPQPGAHCILNATRVRILDCALTETEEPAAAPGTVLRVHDGQVDIALMGGILHAKRLQRDGGKKLGAGEFAAAMGLQAGDAFEDARPLS